MSSDESRRFDAERRWAQEEAERDADALERRRSSLEDVAREAALDGATLRMSAGGRLIEGTALHAAGDLVTVTNGATHIDVRLSAITDLRLNPAKRAGGGRRLPQHPGSFIGRMNELHAVESTVELGGPEVGLTAPGRITVVAQDYVELSTADGVRLIAIAAISYIIRRDDVPDRLRR